MASISGARKWWLIEVSMMDCSCTVDGFTFGLDGWPWKFSRSNARFMIFHKFLVRLQICNLRLA